jgi:hypothetical protein
MCPTNIIVQYIDTTSGSKSGVIHKEKLRIFFIYTLVLCQYYSNVIQKYGKFNEIGKSD